MKHEIFHFLECKVTQVTVKVHPTSSMFLQMVLKLIRRVQTFIAKRTTILITLPMLRHVELETLGCCECSIALCTFDGFVTVLVETHVELSLLQR